jgi:GDP-L-fucose synthase
VEANSKIFVAGKTGMVGSAIIRALHQNGFTNIVSPSSKELDLTRQKDVEEFFASVKPEYVFLAAAKVGGIHANNTYPGDFIYSNLCIQTNVLHSAHLFGTKKLLLLGSSCIYPKATPQPIKEEYLLSGYLEPTNEAYAVAKIAGIEMCKFYRRQYGCNFISAMPTNLYGPGDNYNLENSHVLPALLRKFHEAKIRNDSEVVIWGSGNPLREFMHVDDLADACVFLMKKYNDEIHINTGSGEEISISKLALLIKEIVGFSGALTFDASKPDGTLRKLMLSEKLAGLGWKSRIGLADGVRGTYEGFKVETGYRDQ